MRGTATIVLLVCSCSANDPALEACPGTLEAPLVNASLEETYLGLSDAQVRAVVEVVDAVDSNLGRCTGVFVSPTWVLTAAHCLAIPAPEVVVYGDATEPLAQRPVIRTEPHPELDVALLQIDLHREKREDGAGETLTGVEPLDVVEPGTVPLVPGDAVELVGFGITLTNEARARRFLVEATSEIEPESITVDGFGKSGACLGDSGGPMLARAANGSPVVMGVLSDGSATCVDQDHYVRLDALSDWLRSVTGPRAAKGSSCGTITREGRCLYGSALWCSGEQLVAEACNDTARCGWDVKVSGFRCVAPDLDPCTGADSVGTCLDGAVARCNAGVLETRICGPCSPCRVEADGRPYCAD
jgi:hypothetical protein